MCTSLLGRSRDTDTWVDSFELMGEPQRDLTAEQAASRLRDCADVHYLDAEQSQAP
jgi:UDPglucose--hexose-1-phosphate uridylyltransferase